MSTRYAPSGKHLVDLEHSEYWLLFFTKFQTQFTQIRKIPTVLHVEPHRKQPVTN